MHEIRQESKKSAGQLAYETDVTRTPRYQDGGRRKTWEQLGDIERLSWELNPTARGAA